MSWVRVDDTLSENPKVIGLSDGAFRVYISALCYAARNLTDGIITEAAAKLLAKGRAKRLADELMDAGLFDPTSDGWQIHDYLEFNPSRAEVQRIREERAEAGRVGGLRSGVVRRSGRQASA